MKIEIKRLFEIIEGVMSEDSISNDRLYVLQDRLMEEMEVLSDED